MVIPKPQLTWLIDACSGQMCEAQGMDMDLSTLQGWSEIKQENSLFMFML